MVVEYLIHTTLVTAGLFLLIDVIGDGRGQGTWLRPAQQPPAAAWLGTLFLLAALAIAGLPPLSGFIGKAWILEALRSAGEGALGPGPHLHWILSWVAVLGSSLLVVIALARAGIMLFWQGEPSTSASGGRNARAPAAGALLAASPLLVLLAGPIADYTQRLASQLLDGEAYIATIRGLEPEDPPADMNEKPSKGRPGGVTEGGPP